MEQHMTGTDEEEEDIRWAGVITIRHNVKADDVKKQKTEAETLKHVVCNLNVKNFVTMKGRNITEN